MKKYLVRLKPIDTYFFGGKNTFGEGDNKTYLVESRAFPQQTTLLGMIRQEILILKDIYKENWSNYSKYDRETGKKYKTLMENNIGKNSFSINGGQQNFGIIKGLSPVFLAKNNQFFFKLPLDFGLEFEKKKSGKSYLNKRRKFIPILKVLMLKKGFLINLLVVIYLIIK